MKVSEFVKKLGIRIDKDFDYDLDIIDKKVKFINENRDRAEYNGCEEIIREQNALIDLDYIKASEFIEGITLEEIEDFDIDESTKVLHAFPNFIESLPKDYDKKIEFLKNLKRDTQNTSLVILKKANNTPEKFKTLVCKKPSHLSALEEALKQARIDRDVMYKQGYMPDVSKKFIEFINARFFENNTNLMYIQNEKGEKIKRPGYGSYRGLVFINGNTIPVPNVNVAGASWKPFPSTQVESEMDSLLRMYNESSVHPVLDAIVFKTRFIRIHPFSDANGRTSRILLNYMLVRNKYPTITIAGKEKYVYLNAMQNAITDNNYTEIIKLVLILLNERCDKYISFMEEIREQNKKKLEYIIELEDEKE